ncbi:MAG: sulfite exporter TauE/SafE family protein [Bacteroidota bacterium]
MNYQSLAFFTGLFGSLHCVVMCGPLVMSVPFTGSIWFSLLQKFIYQIGRILTYSLLGFVAGSVGSLFNILGLQQILSFVSGVLLILIAIYHFSGNKRTPNKTYLKLIGPLAKFLGRWMSKPYGGFVAGSLHGFIPCGMVYMAVAASLNTGSAFAGSEFMLYFGLGTTPLLMLTTFIPVVVRRFRAPQVLIPALFLVAGILLITRSLNLQIPYVSAPVLSTTEAPVCN